MKGVVLVSPVAFPFLPGLPQWLHRRKELGTGEIWALGSCCPLWAAQ